jgi:RNA polymerase sigma-70 factor (ECF subfamily)
MSESTSGGSVVQPSRKELPVWAERETAWGELLAGCAKGDQTALASLYDQSSALVYGIALRMMADPGDAEEVTLDVYHQVWRAARSYDRSRGSVTSWLVTLARSRAIDRMRSRAVRARSEEALDRHADTPSFTAGPDETTLARQRRQRILAAMTALSAEQREAIQLAFFSGLTHAELADRLKQPLGTVKTRIRLGIMKLREELGELVV